MKWVLLAQAPHFENHWNRMPLVARGVSQLITDAQLYGRASTSPTFTTVVEQEVACRPGNYPLAAPLPHCVASVGEPLPEAPLLIRGVEIMPLLPYVLDTSLQRPNNSIRVPGSLSPPPAWGGLTPHTPESHSQPR